MAVEPRRDAERPGRRAERLRRRLGLVADDDVSRRERCRSPRRDVGPEARHAGDAADGLLDGRRAPAQGAEVGRLHRPGAATGRDEVPLLRERVPEAGGGGVCRGVPLQRMPAHDPDDRSTLHELVELVGHRVVVDGAHEGAVGIGAQPRVDEPRVRAGVGGRGIPALEAGVEVGREVEARATGRPGRRRRRGRGSRHARGAARRRERARCRRGRRDR